MASHHSLVLLLKKDGLLSGKGSFAAGRKATLLAGIHAAPSVEGMLQATPLGTSRLG